MPLLDCELLSKVYINLIDQKEPIFEFQKQIDQEKYHSQKNRHKLLKKIIQASDEEIYKHKKFLKENLKKNFY